MARSIPQICNEAISDLPAHPITSIDDGSKEAEECDRHLNGVVSDLIGEHDWGHVRRRVALAEVSNDRPDEWAYAYAFPDEMVSPIRLIRGASSSSPSDFVVTPILYWPTLAAGLIHIPYTLANGIFYTNLGGAVLEYSTDAVEPNKWPPLFAQAVIRTLAFRIYRPLLGEKADTREWMVKGDAARQAINLAIADDLNRYPRQRKAFTSEAAIARGVVPSGVPVSGSSLGIGGTDPGDLAGIVGG
jgi:hypothetical protein